MGKCVDCGVKDPTILEFDHITDKKFVVSKMDGSGLDVILDEIAKCELRCVNCHTILTRFQQKSLTDNFYISNIKSIGEFINHESTLENEHLVIDIGEIQKGSKRNYYKRRYEETIRNNKSYMLIYLENFKIRKSMYLSYIRSKIDKYDQTIMARKCSLKWVDQTAARIFVNQNHIQSVKRIEEAVGLYDNNDLVGIMTFNSPHRQNINKNSRILSRMCFKSGVRIIGGANKMLNWYVKTKKPELIITYADHSYTDGKIYEKLGFVKKSTNDDYMYVGQSRIFSKQSQKKSISEKNSGKTELELSKEKGLTRVYNPGKTTYEMIINIHPSS